MAPNNMSIGRLDLMAHLASLLPLWLPGLTKNFRVANSHQHGCMEGGRGKVKRQCHCLTCVEWDEYGLVVECNKSFFTR